MGRETRAKPERAQVIRAGGFVTETRPDDVRVKPWNRRLDELDLEGDEVDQGLDVDPVLRRSSFRLLI